MANFVWENSIGRYLVGFEIKRDIPTYGNKIFSVWISPDSMEAATGSGNYVLSKILSDGLAIHPCIIYLGLTNHQKGVFFGAKKFLVKMTIFGYFWVIFTNTSKLWVIPHVKALDSQKPDRWEYAGAKFQSNNLRNSGPSNIWKCRQNVTTYYKLKAVSRNSPTFWTSIFKQKFWLELIVLYILPHLFRDASV